MKKLFILVLLVILLAVGFIVYKNVKVPTIDNRPTIENPNDNGNVNEDKPISIGIELDKDHIYF